MRVTTKALQLTDDVMKAAGDLLRLQDEAPEGSIKCVFSTFNVKDSDDDVLLPGSIPEVPVKLCSWGHNWKDLVIGKGVIRTNDQVAVFDGQFFLSTEAGREAYETVKALGDLQEWSWGFTIPRGAARKGVFKGEPVRFIERTTPIEVSPVLVGANPMTSTTDIKGAELEAEAGEAEIKTMTDEMTSMCDQAQGSLRALMGSAAADAPVFVLSELLTSMMYLEYFQDDYAMSFMMEPDEAMAAGKDRHDQVVLCIADYIRRYAEEFEAKGLTLLDLPRFDEANQTYAVQGEKVLSAVTSFAARSKSLADYRAKEGRALSDANRTRLKNMLDMLRTASSDLEVLLQETEPSKSQVEPELPPEPADAKADRDQRLRLAEARARI